MRIELPPPESKFQIIHKDDLRLIIPRKDKFDWKPEERKYRSVIIDDDNNIVSLSFPKFGNFGEPGFDDHRKALNDQSVFYTAKVDGSLAIRSVIKGEVVWRTRGTMDGGPFRDHIEKAAEQHPILANPDFLRHMSLLFEFISPNFRIILPYEKDDLIFLGAMNHEDQSLSNWDDTRSIAEMYDFTLVETHDLPSNMGRLIKIVGEWEKAEGIVARTFDGTALVKVKSASYLALHRLRFLLSARALRDLCDEEDITSLDQFKAFILGKGADWELLQDCEPIVNVYIKTRKAVEWTMGKLMQEVLEFSRFHPERKDFATMFVPSLPKEQHPSAFLLLDNRAKQAKIKLHKNMMDRAFEQFKEKEDAEE